MLPFYYRASSLLVFSLSSKPWNQSLFLSLFSLGVIHEILSIIPPSFHTSLFHSDSISSTGPGLNYLTSGPLRHLGGLLACQYCPSIVHISCLALTSFTAFVHPLKYLSTLVLVSLTFLSPTFLLPCLCS